MISWRRFPVGRAAIAAAGAVIFMALAGSLAGAQAPGGYYAPPPPPVDAPPPLPDYTPPADQPPAPAPGQGAGTQLPEPDYSAPAEDAPDYGNAPPLPPEQQAQTPPQPIKATTPLEEGEAYHTRFSGTMTRQGPAGPVTVINPEGVVGSIIDLRDPGEAPEGQHWTSEPQRALARAADAGQVFGITINDNADPDIFVTATSAFGLHLEPGEQRWMNGMWGPDGGPGTVYRLSADTGYVPQPFADITLDGRFNTGAALGNIAYDRWNKQLYVSDLETGMIHRLSGHFGRDLGRYDHGVEGRPRFTDAWPKVSASLNPVPFDPDSSASIDNCAAGPFERHPECWNFSDFRRRVWGMGVRRDEASGQVRLYYSVWGSTSFGNPQWQASGGDRRNSIWSVGIGKDGGFDLSDIRREFVLPGFFPLDPGLGELAGSSHPVSDIEFPDCGKQDVMLLAERGGVRNLGLDKEDAFARPHESRVLRYRLGPDGIWRPDGRFDISFLKRDQAPRIRAGGAGGCDFGFAYDDEGSSDLNRPNESVWMTGDNLCSPQGACFNPATGLFDDTDWVDGMQGSPALSAQEVAPQVAYQPAAAGGAEDEGPSDSYMIDSDDNTGSSESDPGLGVDRNEATLIGDIDIFELCGGETWTPPPETVIPPPPPPVHLRAMTHQRNGSPLHNVERSWHERNWSWHTRDSSWHYRNRSWHQRENSWHSRTTSWHWRDRSWHSRAISWHWRDRSWHDRSRSWHDRNRSWHDRSRSWHSRNISWHWRDRSWHNRNASWHSRDRSWHNRDRSWHDRRQSSHNRDRSYHDRDRSWHARERSWHDRRQSSHNKDRSSHDRDRSWHVRDRSWHDRDRSRGDIHTKARSDADRHNKQRSDADRHNKRRSDAQRHSKAESDAQRHNRTRSEAERHSKERSDAQRHSKAESDAQRHNRTRSEAERHSKQRSDAQRHSKAESDAQRHNRNKSEADRHSKQRSDAQRHSKAESNAQRHNRNKSEADRHSKQSSDAQRHSKAESDAQRHNRNRSQADQHSKQRSDAQRHSKKESNASRDQEGHKKKASEQVNRREPSNR